MKNTCKCKILAVVLVLAVVLYLCAAASADPLIIRSGFCGGEGDGSNLAYTLDNRGLLTIKGTGKMKDYDYNTAPWSRSSVSRVVIEYGATSIGSYAFSNTHLVSAAIPDSVTSIGDNAFRSCNMTVIAVPDSVTSIGSNAFISCEKLESFTFPKGLTSISSGLFCYCSALNSVTIPDHITDIGACAFQGCTGLESIAVPDSVTGIGNSAFLDCTNLTAAVVGKGITVLNKSTFRNCPRLVSVEISGAVTSIGPEAFYNCKSLTGLVLPDSLAGIGSWAFFKCAGLIDVTIPKGVTRIEEYTFDECAGLARIVLPKGVSYIGKGAFYLCDALQDVYYGGSEAARERISVDIANECLFSAAWHYLYDPDTVDISGAEIDVVSDRVYTGSKITPKVTVKYDGQKLKAGTDYTLSYKNNKSIGTATILVSGKGKYTGTVKTAFRIIPKAVKLTSLKAGKNKLAAQWKKGSGITGYEIQYSRNSKFKNAETVTVKKAGKTSVDIPNLLKGRTYYVRIRAYKTVKGVLYCSAWSEAKKAKVK